MPLVQQSFCHPWSLQWPIQVTPWWAKMSGLLHPFHHQSLVPFCEMRGMAAPTS